MTWDPSDIEDTTDRLLVGRGRVRNKGISPATFEKHYRDLLRTVLMTQFVYTGLGSETTGRFIEETLMRNITGIFFLQYAGEVREDVGGGILTQDLLCFRQAASQGELNAEYQPTLFQTIQPTLTTRYLHTMGSLDQWTGVPIYDNIWRDSTGNAYYRQTINLFARRLAEAAVTVQVNLRNARRQRVAYIDADEEKTAHMIDDAIENGQATIFAKRRVGAPSVAESFATLDLETEPTAASEAAAVLQGIMGEALNALGVSGGLSQQKRAQMTEGEVDAPNDLVTALRIARYDSRRWTIDRVNARWNQNIQVIDTGTGG